MNQTTSAIRTREFKKFFAAAYVNEECFEFPDTNIHCRFNYLSHDVLAVQR